MESENTRDPRRQSAFSLESSGSCWVRSRPEVRELEDVDSRVVRKERRLPFGSADESVMLCQDRGSPVAEKPRSKESSLTLKENG